MQTERIYDRENPKRIYYLSMEFLIGRSLGNNVTNLLLDPFVQRAVQQRDLDWLGLLEQEPDAGLGNGGLGRLAVCFLDSMATMQLPAMGYGLRYEYGMFKQTVEDGWQHEQPDNWLRRQDPWEVPRLNETDSVKQARRHGRALAARDFLQRNGDGPCPLPISYRERERLNLYSFKQIGQRDSNDPT